MTEINHRSELLAILQRHAERVKDVERYCIDEAKTEQFLVEPFFETLGYDCRDPRDVHKRFVADVADRKGEKVDYALTRDGNPVVLVEAKGKDNRLGRGEIQQLQRYFPHTSARLAVLTDGIRWHWYKGRSERDQSHLMESTPFLTYDVREPSETAADWLTQVTKDGFNPEELLRISRRNDFTDKISDWIHRTFVNPSDTAAVEVRKVVGLDASSQETMLVLDAIRSAWDRVVGGPTDVRGQETTASEESDAADELVNAPTADQPTASPTVTVTSANKLRFESRLDDELDIGNGKTLSRSKKRRAWNFDGEEWHVERSGTRLTTVVLGQLLGCDSRRDDAHALADQFGLRVFEEPPRDWRWERVPGFDNLYHDKNTSAQQRRDFLVTVAEKIAFNPPQEHPLSMSGRIEWWLPDLKA